MKYVIGFKILLTPTNTVLFYQGGSAVYGRLQ
jgi:hypothetical protein